MSFVAIDGSASPLFTLRPRNLPNVKRRSVSAGGKDRQMQSDELRRPRENDLLPQGSEPSPLASLRFFKLCNQTQPVCERARNATPEPLFGVADVIVPPVAPRERAVTHQ